MRIGIVNIGDELLSGKILNTNQMELSRLLVPLGHDIVFAMVIGDSVKALAGLMESIVAHRSEAHYLHIDVLVLTGGLGPTQDDLTRIAVAELLGRGVKEDAHALGWLCAFLGKEEHEIPPGQRIQAAIPEQTIPLQNPVGTACGFKFSYQGIQTFAFPGVPVELKTMADLHLLPVLSSDKVLLERTLWTFGWSEGSQRQAFAGIDISSPYQFSSLPTEKGVRVSLSCLIPRQDRERRQVELDALWRKLNAAIPPEAIVDAGGGDLIETVHKLLITEHAQVSVAESCTGGGLAALLTELPGSSAVFQKGFLTYSNQAKCDLLGIDPDLIQTYGAVSEPCVLAMAKGCLKQSRAHYACAISGIAGPDGGSEEKPVGTVWIAVASQSLTVARRFQFRGNRSAVRSRSCYSALNLLRLLLTKQLSK